MINGDSFSWIDEKTSEIKRFSDFEDGYLSKISIIKVKEKLIFDNRCYGDAGYEWYLFLPDHKNYCLTVIYDSTGQILEWYIDITYQNSVSEEGIPFHYDLYLDISVFPDSSVALLDEDELSAALETHDISRETYEKAYRIRSGILNSPLVQVDFLKDLSARIKKQFP